MPTVLIALISGIGTAINGLFGFKGDQAKTVQEALKVLESVNSTDGQAMTAAADALSAILTNGSWLERNWRPMFMVVLMVLVLCSFFGWVPPHLNDTMSPTMQQIWDLLKIGLGGYLPCRTIEKIVQQVNIGSILKTLIGKRVS